MQKHLIFLKMRGISYKIFSEIGEDFICVTELTGSRFHETYIPEDIGTRQDNTVKC